MDYEEDSIYTSSQPQVASTPAKRRPVARMHASRVSKARKSLKIKNKRTVSRPRLLERHRPDAATVRVSNTEVRAGWSVRRMDGKCPPFNDKAGWMEDPTNRRIYAYGGLAPGDESEIPTSDFYVCDTTTMKWKNITVSYSMFFLLRIRAHCLYSLFLEFSQVSRPL